MAAYETLHHVVGIEVWSWLVVSGAAAIAVAASIETAAPAVAGDRATADL